MSLLAAHGVTRAAAPAKRRARSAAPLFRIAARLSEAQIHRSVLAFLRAALPEAIIIHVGNGGSRSGPIEGKNLKRMGVTAGVPDLQIILAGGKTLFLEIKREGGYLSDAQKQFHSALDYLGHHVFTVRSIDDAREILAGLKIEMRAA